MESVRRTGVAKKAEINQADHSNSSVTVIACSAGGEALFEIDEAT